jgi:hypothetical protein
VVRHLRYEAPDNNWQNAKCRVVGVIDGFDPFFVKENTEAEQEALDFCNGKQDGKVCPDRHECLLFALTNNEKEGVWGGVGETDRKALRKRWPLRKGTREEGRTVWQPRREWRWYRKGTPAKWYPPEVLTREDDDPDPEDD